MTDHNEFVLSFQIPNYAINISTVPKEASLVLFTPSTTHIYSTAPTGSTYPI